MATHYGEAPSLYMVEGPGVKMLKTLANKVRGDEVKVGDIVFIGGGKTPWTITRRHLAATPKPNDVNGHLVSVDTVSPKGSKRTFVAADLYWN